MYDGTPAYFVNGFDYGTILMSVIGQSIRLSTQIVLSFDVKLLHLT